MPFFKNISLEVSGNDFNLTTNVNKEKVKFQIPNLKFPEADVTNICRAAKSYNFDFHKIPLISMIFTTYLFHNN